MQFASNIEFQQMQQQYNQHKLPMHALQQAQQHQLNVQQQSDTQGHSQNANKTMIADPKRGIRGPSQQQGSQQQLQMPTQHPQGHSHQQILQHQQQGLQHPGSGSQQHSMLGGPSFRPGTYLLLQIQYRIVVIDFYVHHSSKPI